MILIADSGGSKIDWRMIHIGGRIESVHSSGFNPYNQPISNLKHTIEKDLLPHVAGNVGHVFFYGAGITYTENKQAVTAVLQSFFTQSVVHVYSDLLGVARALCGNIPGIVCILGTGSNCGWYDGSSVYCKTPSLGWILGDEGSGSYLGKRLIKDYLYKKMPPAIAKLFYDRHPWSEEELLQHLYSEKRTAVFLGGFSSFIATYIKDSYCQQLVRDSFEDFFRIKVMTYDNYQSTKIHFTGSIAFYYKDLIRQVAHNMGITTGDIIQTPIDRLELYHQKHQPSK